MQNLPWCATFPGSPGGAAICCRAKMRAPHLAWAHLPYRRVDIGNLAKSREGQRAARRGQQALQMPACNYEYFVLHFRFALYTLSLHFVSGGKHLTALWARGRSILTVVTASASCCCCCCGLLLPFSDHTLEREAIISEMQVECLTGAVS